MNYSDFHKNHVRYNINTINKAKSKNVLFRYLNCILKFNNNLCKVDYSEILYFTKKNSRTCGHDLKLLASK